MTAQLDQEARALLRLLLQVLQNADPNDPKTFITYSEAHLRLGLKVQFQNPGRSLQQQGLNSLADWAKAQGVPAITGLIVREVERDPGPGYFRFYGKREIDDLPWWINEIKRAKQFDWAAHQPQGPIGASAQSEIHDAGSTKLTVSAIARPDSRFFLKSEYGPLSSEWPVVAFSSEAFGLKLQRDFRPDTDFIVYTGTGGVATRNPEHRARLLSVIRIDTQEIRLTETAIPEDIWNWAHTNYPGQWENCFRALEGWKIVDYPRTAEVIPESYANMGKYPHRGGVLEIVGEERLALLELAIAPVALAGENLSVEVEDKTASATESEMFNEAKRIANLIFARVAVSGTTLEHTAPERTAPDNLVINVRELLRARPLVCYLCGGPMQIKPRNRLLQPSPDRIDSSIGDYGPQNLKLAHLACNLGKNASSVAEFHQWLEVLRHV
ncbi:MAG: hypothetical protein ABR898_09730 [Terracidiphilus sp.]|jgi:hypothetical protein